MSMNRSNVYPPCLFILLAGACVPDEDLVDPLASTEASTEGDSSASISVSSTSVGQTATSSDSVTTTGGETTTTGTGEFVVVVHGHANILEPEGPAAGAIVAIDTQDGRIETIADEQGRAVFEGFALNGGVVNVTAAQPGFELHSWLGVSEGETNEAGEFNLWLWRASRYVTKDTVELYGSALNMTDEKHDTIISAGGVVSGSTGPEWSMNIAPGEAFEVVAIEIEYVTSPSGTSENPIYGWFTADHEGVSEDAELIVDFGTPTQPTLVSGSYSLPLRPDSPLRNPAFGLVFTETQAIPRAGLSTFTEVSADGNTCNFEHEYVAPKNLEGLRACYHIWGKGHLSDACTPGFPVDGPADVVLLDVPLRAPVVGQQLHDPVDFELFDVGVRGELTLEYDDTRVWRVTGMIDGGSITVPAPPSGYEIVDTYLEGFLSAVRYNPGRSDLEAWTYSPKFTVAS